MDAIAPWHIIVVAVVAAVLFFGWKQLPDMSRSLGRSLRIFKTEIKGMADDAGQPAALTSPVAASAVPATTPETHGCPLPMADTKPPRPEVATDSNR
jgi:sec-independent protein translocase protein TatA